MSEEKTPEVTKEQKELQERVAKFDEGYKKLVESTEIGLNPIITPNGPVLQKVDIRELQAQADKNAEATE